MAARGLLCSREMEVDSDLYRGRRSHPFVEGSALGDGLKEARGDLVWSFKIGGRLNPLNGPPAPAPIVTIAAPPNPDRNKE